MATTAWVAVIPVKRLAAAKTRLRGALPADRHADLVLALVADTVAAALACPEVAEALVVTDDPAVTASALAAGARVAPDPPRRPYRPGQRGLAGHPAGAPVDGLNAAVRFGADQLAGLGRWRAALTGDLPALRPAELAAALRAAAELAAAGQPGRRGYVADAAGTGTVLLAAPPGVPLAPSFGVDSAAAHARSGAAELTGSWPSLRHDVDTPADLRSVVALGLGPRTAAVLAALPVGLGQVV